MLERGKGLRILMDVRNEKSLIPILTCAKHIPEHPNTAQKLSSSSHGSVEELVLHYTSKMSRLGLLVLAAAPLSLAGLLVDPSAGTSVGFPANADQEEVTRNLGGTFTLYGIGTTNIHISVNGFMGLANVSFLSADRSLSQLTTAANTQVVAPLYDDFAFGPGSNVVDQGVANTYYAVTWESIYGFTHVSPGQTSDFQAVLFLANTTLGGFQFQSGDIAFSYGKLGAPVVDNTFTVGVAGGPANFTGNPSSSDGELSDFTKLPSGSSILLYRPLIISGDDGESSVSYSVSIEDPIATPEP